MLTCDLQKAGEGQQEEDGEVALEHRELVTCPDGRNKELLKLKN